MGGYCTFFVSLINTHTIKSLEQKEIKIILVDLNRFNPPLGGPGGKKNKWRLYIGRGQKEEKAADNI